MIAAHITVDVILSKFSVIEKIKTIGDIVMLGGPFDIVTNTEPTSNPQVAPFDVSPPQATVECPLSPPVPRTSIQTAVDEALAIVSLCRDETTIQAGLHVGDVTGAVIGTERLAFDVFGDSVNVASRVMTNCPSASGHVAVSEQCYNVVASLLLAA